MQIELLQDHSLMPLYTILQLPLYLQENKFHYNNNNQDHIVLSHALYERLFYRSIRLFLD